MKKSTLTVFFILTGCLLFLSGIWIYFQKSMDQVDLGEGERAASYEKHYLMISSEDNALMWDSIYESASEAAKELDVYVELVTTGQGTDYDLEDYLRIGIASQVDGIILEADGSEEEQNLIQEALEDNIPVVTVLTDDSSSDRISFVGLNSYQLGNAYTEQVLGLLKENQTTQVMLLSNSQSKTQETNLIYYQIKKELEEKLAEDGIIVKKMQSLGAGKHIFSHIEWHMKGYLIELSPTGKQPELIFASLEEVEDTYSLPTAFRTYREKMRKILNKQKEGGVSEKKGVL